VNGKSGFGMEAYDILTGKIERLNAAE